MNERRGQGVRARDRTCWTWTKLIAGERGEEISQVVDFAAEQNFGDPQRLFAALEMLAQSKSVTEVAVAVGYDSVSAFIEMFRTMLGTTPQAYFRSKQKPMPK